MGGSGGAGAPAVPGPPTYAPEITFGPPIPGSPWESRARREFYVTPPPASLPQPQFYAPEIYAGPPLPGAPWFRVYDPGHVLVTPDPTIPVAPDRPLTREPVIARQPIADQRVRRISEIVSDVFNSLAERGQLQRLGPDDWRVKVVFEAGAPPSVGNDETEGFRRGDFWADRGANHLYYCVEAAAGAAVWRRIAFEE